MMCASESSIDGGLSASPPFAPIALPDTSNQGSGWLTQLHGASLVVGTGVVEWNQLWRGYGECRNREPGPPSVQTAAGFTSDQLVPVAKSDATCRSVGVSRTSLPLLWLTGFASKALVISLRPLVYAWLGPCGGDVFPDLGGEGIEGVVVVVAYAFKGEEELPAHWSPWMNA